VLRTSTATFQSDRGTSGKTVNTALCFSQGTTTQVSAGNFVGSNSTVVYGRWFRAMQIDGHPSSGSADLTGSHIQSICAVRYLAGPDPPNVTFTPDPAGFPRWRSNSENGTRLGAAIVLAVRERTVTIPTSICGRTSNLSNAVRKDMG
jgi:hypothetical protein